MNYEKSTMDSEKDELVVMAVLHWKLLLKYTENLTLKPI